MIERQAAVEGDCSEVRTRRAVNRSSAFLKGT
jgi:hypothetical protein